MDLLNENRSLVHAGKLLRQPDTGFEWNGWTELFVLLFDNYCKHPRITVLRREFDARISGHDQAERKRRRDKI
jgi:hypothetical protein